jgi:hypothetical protein
MLKQMLPVAERRERILLAPGSHIGRLTEAFSIRDPLSSLQARTFIHSSVGLKNRPGSPLLKLFFSHSGQRLPDRCYPFVRLFLLSFCRFRRLPPPFLRATLIRNHLLHGSHPIPQTQPKAIAQANLQPAHDDPPASLREIRKGRRPIASGQKLLVEQVAARHGDHRCQRISAQSPPRFDTATSRPDPLCLGSAELVPQARVADLQRLEVEQTVCDPFQQPADSLPRQH